MTSSPSNYASCPSHCCVNHGCKYGYEECPVRRGAVTQEYACEYCHVVFEDEGVTDYSLVGASFVIGYGREDRGTDDVPDLAAVRSAVEAALLNLEVSTGWTIKIVK